MLALPVKTIHSLFSNRLQPRSYLRRIWTYMISIIIQPESLLVYNLSRGEPR